MTNRGQQAVASRVVMTQLAEHVPLCLIMDLTMPAGPHSAELLAREASPATARRGGRASATDTRTDFLAGAADC